MFGSGNEWLRLLDWAAVALERAAEWVLQGWLMVFHVAGSSLALKFLGTGWQPCSKVAVSRYAFLEAGEPLDPDNCRRRRLGYSKTMTI
jgi:hypothetical protein